MIIKPTCVGIYRKNIFNSITNQRSPPETSKTSRDAYLGLNLTIHVNNISIHLVRQFHQIIQQALHYNEVSAQLSAPQLEICVSSIASLWLVNATV